MELRRSWATLVAAAALTAAVPAGAASRLPACASGRLSASSGRALEAAVAAEERRLPAGARGAGRTFQAGVAAYLYGLPDLMLRRTVAGYPRNRMISIGALTDPSTRSVVAPNHDTLYSVAQLDLGDGPLVLQTPPTGGRYSVLQLLDTFTNAFAYLGDGAAARTGEAVALVPPGWRGTLPAGVARVQSPSEVVWLLGRTLVDEEPADLAAARALMSRYAVTPLAAYATGTRTRSLVLDGFPAGGRKAVAPPTGLAFFDELGSALAADPPPARDACALAAFRAAGIGAGLAPGRTATGAEGRALRAAATAAPRVLSRLVAAARASGRRNGWTALPRDVGAFGTDYVGRAVVTRVGLGANTVAQALYPTTGEDSRGRALDGRHAYRLHFAPGQLPPVEEFWSLTLYDRELELVPNPLRRYAIGDRTAGLRRDADGGLTLTIAHARPAAARRANWLPAPAGRFSLYLRLYEPKPAASSGRWVPPPVVRVR